MDRGTDAEKQKGKIKKKKKKKKIRNACKLIVGKPEELIEKSEKRNRVPGRTENFLLSTAHMPELELPSFLTRKSGFFPQK
jgi:hypothetical protein